MNNNFWYRAYSFFQGRYGNDALNLAILGSSVLISVGFRFTPFWWGSFISAVPVALYIFRAMSRNIERRRRENEVFLKVFRWIGARVRSIRTWFENLRTKRQARKARTADKTHRYLKCPDCSAQLRVPKGRGKIEITCPKCGKHFIKKV